MGPSASTNARDVLSHLSVRQSDARIHTIHTAPNIATKLRARAISFMGEKVCVLVTPNVRANLRAEADDAWPRKA
jgi:hypothetical protein